MFLSFRVFVEAELLSKSYAFIGGTAIFCITTLLISDKRRMDIDAIAFLLLSFIGYLLLMTVISPSKSSNIHILLLTSFVLLFGSFRLIPNECAKNIDLIILWTCIAQACYGLLQYAGVLHTYEAFRITGSFDNTAGFAACLVSGFPFALSSSYANHWKKRSGIIALPTISIAILLSGSRSGIIAIVIVSGVFFANKYYETIRKHGRLLILAFMFACVIGAGLFLMRKDSSMGRISVWKNSCEMIKENPIFGGGAGSFMANYMSYQANYFERHINDSGARLADNITHPFNEYLMLTVEYGAVGLLLLLAMIFVIIAGRKQITDYHLCLLAIGIFACFSYPLRYTFVVAVIAYCLANIKSTNTFVVPIDIWSKSICVILSGSALVFCAKDIEFERQWGLMAQKLQSETTEQTLAEYEKLYRIWNGDPLFLYNYGAGLHVTKQYSKSNRIMNECAEYFNNYDVQMIIAGNYEKLNVIDDAEAHYLRAAYMCPNRFMPLYRLMLLYKSSGQDEKATRIAREIISKPIKINSSIVSRIKKSARDHVGECAVR